MSHPNVQAHRIRKAAAMSSYLESMDPQPTVEEVAAFTEAQWIKLSQAAEVSPPSDATKELTVRYYQIADENRHIDPFEGI